MPPELDRFTALVGAHQDALWRLGRGYERDPDRRRDLHQEILLALWRALPGFEGRCGRDRALPMVSNMLRQGRRAYTLGARAAQADERATA